MYEKCNNIVEMLTVITEGSMVAQRYVGKRFFRNHRLY